MDSVINKIAPSLEPSTFPETVGPLPGGIPSLLVSENKKKNFAPRKKKKIVELHENLSGKKAEDQKSIVITGHETFLQNKCCTCHTASLGTREEGADGSKQKTTHHVS
jgi:hypothetical protein